MIKILFITTFCCFILSMSMAQDITFKKDVFRGNKYYKEGEQISMRYIVDDLMEKDSPEHDMMSEALYRKNLSNGLAFGAGLLVGTRLGGTFANRQTILLLSGGSLALAIASIPLKVSSNKLSVQAIDIYNSSLSTIYEKQINYVVHLNLNENGIGLVMEW